MLIIIIIISLLILIALFLISKYIKKKIKIVLILFVALIAIYFSFVFIDMSRVYSLKEPIIAREQYNTLYMSGYKGIGYNIYIKKHEGKIESITMNMFGKVIASTIE